MYEDPTGTIDVRDGTLQGGLATSGHVASLETMHLLQHLICTI